LEAAVTQRELALRTGLTQHTISDIEQQLVKARPSTMRRLADALGCTPRDLMEESP
jgi:transcriptional regulator with XRE-family HTH domain